MIAIDILKRVCEQNASDVHLSVGAKVAYRIDGDLVYEGDPLTSETIKLAAEDILPANEWDKLERIGEVDFAYTLPSEARFRVNVYRQRGFISIAARRIPIAIPSCDEIGLPETVKSFTESPHGLILITGPTGSGKSTTLASLIQHINTTRSCHIITLEDPIEYLHTHKQSVIDQREIGVDTQDFPSALRAALRQDPDVILVGEMRDLETISTAITAAETGHLVFATLHTSDTIQSIDRIIDVFPSDQQGQIRMQLAGVLRGIVSQRLHKKRPQPGRVASFEILVNTPAVANLIRTQKVHQITSVLQTGRSFGMQTMEAHLRQLVGMGMISNEAISQWISA